METPGLDRHRLPPGVAHTRVPVASHGCSIRFTPLPWETQWAIVRQTCLFSLQAKGVRFLMVTQNCRGAELVSLQGQV